MSSATGGVALPGQRLADAGALTAGEGTYAHDGGIFASVLGAWRVAADGRVEVKRAGKAIGTAQVLRLGDTVVCRAVKVTPRQVVVDILCVGDTVLQEAFPGTLRLEDVRSHDVDKLVQEDMFSPGMLVKAAVLSFGDTRSYFLSTAKPGMGIVKAQSQPASDAMETD
jgi:exosome complex component CSL4